MVCICRTSFLVAFTLMTAALGGFAAADRWSQFRGNDMDGVAQSTHPEQWTNTNNVAWSIEMKSRNTVH